MINKFDILDLIRRINNFKKNTVAVDLLYFDLNMQNKGSLGYSFYIRPKNFDRSTTRIDRIKISPIGYMEIDSFVIIAILVQGFIQTVITLQCLRNLTNYDLLL